MVWRTVGTATGPLTGLPPGREETVSYSTPAESGGPEKLAPLGRRREGRNEILGVPLTPSPLNGFLPVP